MAFGSVRSGLRVLLERFLHVQGYRLIQLNADPSTLVVACERLKRLGFNPRTVIDVGVGNGTPWLYKSFPQAHFELFEANEGFRPTIENATRGLDVKVHYCALGQEHAELFFDEYTNSPTSSTFATYDDAYLKAAGREPTSEHVHRAPIAVKPLDDFGPFSGPTLLKLDVEGFESHVLRGARNTLRNVDVVISEVSVAKRTKDELSFAAYVALLEELGFSLVNIAEIESIGRGGPIAYMDAVFVRSDSRVRYGENFK